MSEEIKNVDITKYPEGLKKLAAELKMPISEEESAKREAMVMSLIATLVRQ